MRIAYINQRFTADRQAAINQANEIIDEYLAKGFRLTLRQLYYQFVSRDLLANQQSEYKRLGEIINAGRLAGLIDWEAIEDRGRNLKRLPTWSSPAAIIDDCAAQYSVDYWENQAHRVEVWIEKEALIGVIAGVCERMRLPYFACKGYTSQSEMWAAGHHRIRAYRQAGQAAVILHLGDHDPSGIDMSRDIADRLAMFAGPDAVKVRRLALNWNQVEQYNPPPNPAKTTDSRFAGYADRFGEDSWELDALDPQTIADLIETATLEFIDAAAWHAARQREELARADLRRLADRYESVRRYLNRPKGK